MRYIILHQKVTLVLKGHDIVMRPLAKRDDISYVSTCSIWNITFHHVYIRKTNIIFHYLDIHFFIVTLQNFKKKFNINQYFSR